VAGAAAAGVTAGGAPCTVPGGVPADAAGGATAAGDAAGRPVFWQEKTTSAERRTKAAESHRVTVPCTTRISAVQPVG